MYIFFDTETNGLPKNWKGSLTDVNNWPRVIQLAFIVTDENFNETFRFCELIKPNNWIIPNEKFWIDNGYSTEINLEKGIDMFDALDIFIYYLNKCEYMFAHNMKFDYPILICEMIRYNIKASKKLNKICTMEGSTSFCNLPRNKWPKLEELHEILFGEKFDNAHDALADVSATVRCAKKLVELNVIEIPK